MTGEFPWGRLRQSCANGKDNNMCLAGPGKIVSINETDPLFRLGVVDFGGVTREVNLACVPEAVLGDYVIVHVGMALSVLDKETALQTRREMREIVENTDPV